MKHALTLLVLISLASVCLSQDYTTKNVMTLGDAQSPEATIDDVSWIQGYWTGAIFGDRFEEIWSPPVNGTMMGSFKHLDGENVNFYELMTLSAQNGQIVMKVKHFHAEFTAWEDKPDYVQFPLIGVTDDALHFHGMSFYRRTPDHLQAYLVMRSGDSVREIPLEYHRVR